MIFDNHSILNCKAITDRCISVKIANLDNLPVITKQQDKDVYDVKKQLRRLILGKINNIPTEICSQITKRTKSNDAIDQINNILIHKSVEELNPANFYAYFKNCPESIQKLARDIISKEVQKQNSFSMHRNEETKENTNDLMVKSAVSYGDSEVDDSNQYEESKSGFRFEYDRDQDEESKSGFRFEYESNQANDTLLKTAITQVD